MSDTGVAPLVALRRHAAHAPWALDELATLADELLAATGHAPPRATTERTVRFYVSRGVVRAPFGRGPGSTWGYPHLVELLAARLAQEGGESLELVASRRLALDDPALECFTAERLGAVPSQLPGEATASPPSPGGAAWRRFTVAAGVELHLAADHPLVGDPGRLAALLDGLTRETASSAPES